MFEKDKIVLVPFPFTDLSSAKIRPAVIISKYSLGEDVIAAFISSKPLKRLLKTDIVIKTSSRSFDLTGLKSDSVIKLSKIATLDKKIILGELGAIGTDIRKEIDKRLKILFGL